MVRCPCCCYLHWTFILRLRGFKALKQSTKLLFLVLRRPADALKTYKELLTYTKSAVTRNYAEKTINSILDYVGGGKSGPVEVNILEQFYEATKSALTEAKNDVRIFVLSCNGRRMLNWNDAAVIGQDQSEAREALARSQGIQSTSEGSFLRVIWTDKQPLLICIDCQILNELYQSTLGESGEDQAQKGTQLLEIYALEIQMHNQRKNYKKLKVIISPSSP